MVYFSSVASALFITAMSTPSMAAGTVSTRTYPSVPRRKEKGFQRCAHLDLLLTVVALVELCREGIMVSWGGRGWGSLKFPACITATAIATSTSKVLGPTFRSNFASLSNCALSTPATSNITSLSPPSHLHCFSLFDATAKTTTRVAKRGWGGSFQGFQQALGSTTLEAGVKMRYSRQQRSGVAQYLGIVSNNS